MKKIALHWQILIALILAVLYGLYLTEYVEYVSMDGDAFPERSEDGDSAFNS